MLNASSSVLCTSSGLSNKCKRRGALPSHHVHEPIGDGAVLVWIEGVVEGPAEPVDCLAWIPKVELVPL